MSFLDPHQAIVLAAAGLSIVLASWIAYLRTIPSGRVPVWPLGAIVVQGLGIALAGAGIASWLVRGGSAATLAPAIPAISMGLFFYWLLSQRKTPIGEIRVAVGAELLPFEALTPEGTSFSSGELEGDRVLIKFFRGGW